MSELKSFIVLYDGKFIRAYEESEADKVIAELERRLNEAHTELELWRDGSIISEEHQKELDGKRHADYKRCLAMADKCESMCYWFSARFDHHELVDNVKWELFDRWRLRWAKLADKFKESK